VDPLKKISKSYFKGTLPKFSKKNKILGKFFPFPKLWIPKKSCNKNCFPLSLSQKKVV